MVRLNVEYQIIWRKKKKLHGVKSENMKSKPAKLISRLFKKFADSYLKLIYKTNRICLFWSENNLNLHNPTSSFNFNPFSQIQHYHWIHWFQKRATVEENLSLEIACMAASAAWLRQRISLKNRHYQTTPKVQGWHKEVHCMRGVDCYCY